MGNKQAGEANHELKKRLKKDPQHVEQEIVRGKAKEGEKWKEPMLKSLGTKKEEIAESKKIISEINQMKKTEKFQRTDTMWTVQTEFEEFTYFNYCRLRANGAEARPIVVSVSIDSIQFLDHTTSKTVETAVPHSIRSITYENKSCARVDFAFGHTTFFIEQEDVHALTELLLKVFDDTVGKITALIAGKLKEIKDKGFCVIDDRVKMVVNGSESETVPIKLTITSDSIEVAKKNDGKEVLGTYKFAFSNFEPCITTSDIGVEGECIFKIPNNPSVTIAPSRECTNLIIDNVIRLMIDEKRKVMRSS